MQDYLRLHLVILLWGVTAVLGNLIELSATQVVLYRSVLAAGLLAAYLRHQALIPRKLCVQLLLNGMLLGFHWVLFFVAVKVANVSVCMVGMATIAFWTSLLEPMMIRSRKFELVNAFLGVFVVVAVYIIFRSETQFHYGLIVALCSALVATVFSIFNGQFSGKADESTIVMYEMAGAALFCCASMMFAPLIGIEPEVSRWAPTLAEWGWLMILVVFCTVYAYLMYVELLRRLSVFTINFANNLEPIYGIVLGSLLFGDHQHVGVGFYVGAAMILSAVLVQPWLTGRSA